MPQSLYFRCLTFLPTLQFSLLSSDADVLTNFVKSGGHLIIFGGTTSLSFTSSLSSIISFSSTSWSQPLTVPHQFLQDPSCPVNRNLPAHVILSSPHIRTFGVISDPNARTCHRSTQEGVPTVVVKSVGLGHLVYISLTPDDVYSSNINDWNYFSTLIVNSLSITSQDPVLVPSNVLLIKFSQDPDKTLFGPLENLLTFMKVGFHSVFLYQVDDKTDVSAYETIILAAPPSAYLSGFSDSLSTVFEWLEKSGKRVVLFGTTASSYSNEFAPIITFKGLLDCTSATTRTYDAIVKDPSDYLSQGLPPNYIFASKQCTLTCATVVDTQARIPIRRQDGFGMQLVAAKAVGSGVFVYIDLPTNCLSPADFQYHSSLLFNVLTITNVQAKRTSFPSLAVVQLSHSPNSYLRMPYVYRSVQEALDTAGLQYDFLNPSAINYSSLSHYSEFIILYNYSINFLDTVERILKSGRPVFFMGAAEGPNWLLFIEEFRPIQHIGHHMPRPFKPHFKVSRRGHPLVDGLPLNTSFNFQPFYTILPSAFDVVTVAVTDDNAPLLTCKTSELWDTTFTLFAVSGNKLYSSDGDDIKFFATLFRNWRKLTPKDCIVTRKKHLVHLDVHPSYVPHLMNTVQAALNGPPLYDADPVYDTAFNMRLDYNLTHYSSIFISLDRRSWLPSDFFDTLRRSMTITKQKVFIIGTRDSSFPAAFAKLVNVTYIGETMCPNPALKVTAPNHPLLKFFPPIVAGSKSLSNFRTRYVDITETTDITVLARNSHNVPILVEKIFSQSKLFYFTCLLKGWSDEESYFRDLLLFNFYRSELLFSE
ncbi:hypothetical protein RCL1_001296 [Eukaryota sp. TZLM3-RCL]